MVKNAKIKNSIETFWMIFKHRAGVLILPNENLQEVYEGIWGYNAVISTASISCVFFVFNYMSITFGMINLMASIGIQYALRATLVLQVSLIFVDKTLLFCISCLQLNVPVLTMPFALPTIVMIYLTDKFGLLNRVENMSYPEKQAYEWHIRSKVSPNNTPRI